MRGGLKIERCSSEEEGPKKESNKELSGWLKNFADKLDANKTAVQSVQKAQQPSIYEQLNSIINGKRALYSSVEEAVKDYQEKTGLKNYLNQISAENSTASVQKAAQQILAVSEESEDEEKKNLKPEILVKHPAVESYINSIIDNNPYLDIPVILHMVGEAFYRSGVNQSDLDDRDLAVYINNILVEKAKPINYGEPVANFGLNNSDSYYVNNDPFIGLRPASRH